jgi:hypothetical protein
MIQNNYRTIQLSTCCKASIRVDGGMRAHERYYRCNHCDRVTNTMDAYKLKSPPYTIVLNLPIN